MERTFISTLEASESWVTGDLHKFRVKGFWLTVDDNITIPVIILVNRIPFLGYSLDISDVLSQLFLFGFYFIFLN